MLYVTISYVWDLTCATSTCWEVHIPELPPKWKSIYLQTGICCADIYQLSSIISEQRLNWITPGSPKPSYHGWVRWVVNLEKTIGFYSSNMKGEMGVGRKQNKTPPPQKNPMLNTYYFCPDDTSLSKDYWSRHTSPAWDSDSSRMKGISVSKLAKKLVHWCSKIIKS